jgi:WD40 repeat protein
MLCQAFELSNRQIVVCAISPDCQTIASTDFCHHNTTPHRLQFWDISQGSFSLLDELENTYGKVTKIAFCADSKTVALGNFQGKIALQEVNTGRLIKTL